MLKGARQDHQMAAAQVLEQLAPKDPVVVKELGAALGTAQRPVRLVLLDAIGRIASPSSVAVLLPLLESTDDEMKDRATKALTRIGPAAVKPITRQILDATPSARRALLGVLSRVRSADSVKALLSLAAAGHPDASREAALALVAQSQTMTRPEAARLRSQVEAVLRTPPDKAPPGSLSAGLQVLAAVGQPGSLGILLRLVGAKYPEAIRRDALLAISGVLRGGVIPHKALDAILLVIEAGPSPALRSAALEVLGAVQLPASSLDSILELLDHTDPAVRRFAARALGGKGLGGIKSARKLITLLADGDPSLREAAAEPLGRLPEAASLLYDELLAATEIHRSWALAYILKHHVARLRKPAVRALFAKSVTALAADDRIWEPLLYVVRHHDPKLMYDWLMEEAARLKKARKYAEAEACLKPLTRGDHFDSEARYALALAGIRASRARGSSGSPAAASCMDLFKQLVRDTSFPLLDRLKKERTHLETEDLYFLGFHLSEGTPDEKELGGELLKIVAARAAGSKLGKAARSKLRSEGLAL